MTIMTEQARMSRRSRDLEASKSLTVDLREAVHSVAVDTPSNAAFALRLLLGIAVQMSFDARTAQMMMARLGIVGRSQTLAQVGLTYGISRERVRQIMRKALRRLRHRSAPECVALRLALYSLLPADAGSLGFDSAERLIKLVETGEFGCLGPIVTAFEEVLGLAPSTLRAIIDEANLRQREQDLEVIARRRRLSAVEDLLQRAIWPPTVAETSRLPWSERTREVNDRFGSTIRVKSNINARPVQAESYLEAELFSLLESAPEVITAYQEQPIRIEYTMDGQRRSYFPDAAVLTASRSSMLVEVKPYYELFLYRNVLKVGTAIEWCQYHGFGFLLFTGRSASSRYRSSENASKQGAAIVDAVRRNGGKRMTYGELRAAFPESRVLHLCAAVLLADLRLEFAPFSLSVAPSDTQQKFKLWRIAMNSLGGKSAKTSPTEAYGAHRVDCVKNDVD